MAGKTGGLNSKRSLFVFIVVMMILVPMVSIAYKLVLLNFSLADLVPVVSHRIEVMMRVDGHGENINMSVYLPKNDARQTISEEYNDSSGFTLALENDPLNRRATWAGESVEGTRTLRYGFSVQATGVRYNIPENLSIQQNIPSDIKAYLIEEEGVQVSSPLIKQTLDKLFPSGESLKMKETLTRIHRYLQDDFANKNFSGYTDALTALKLGEASCNGKGRLFVAMARRLGIPARLVGGVIMNPGTKRTSHQWVEIFVQGHWVPFDTINDHMTELPPNFLALYYGDKVLFRHTSNVNFQYHFQTSKKLVPRQEIENTLGSSSINIANFYAIFDRIGISQNLLKIIIMIPLGALVTVIFRNVIGLETYGTFLPALIAVAARNTGLLWGLAGFVLVIFITSLVRRLLDWMQLLHSPKMAILLTTVVITLLGLSFLGVQANLFELAHMSLFPIAILAITAERFAITEVEQGFKKAAALMVMTLLVTSACYAVMNSLFLQSMFLTFQELLFVVIAINLWLGKWIGMRMTEFIRFRRLILGETRA